MRMFNQVVIIGTGLIGGSLGLALKKQRLAGKVIGISRHLRNAKIAKKIGAIDKVGLSLEAVSGADLVILATPIDKIIDFAPEIAAKIKKDCIVIDVGSTKERIVSRLSALIPNFLGCHPLAGSEKKGAINLEADIFKGSVCILTPTVKTKPVILNKIRFLWEKIGASVVVLSPDRHDQILAFTSHLPHLVAFSLIGSVPDKCLKLSSTGLRDTTRISASDIKLWSQIFLSNRSNLLTALLAFEKELVDLKIALKNKDKKSLERILSLAQKKRKKIE